MRCLKLLPALGLVLVACTDAPAPTEPEPPLFSTTASLGYTAIDLGTLGGGSSYAYQINEAGQVVGWSETASGERHWFLWDGEMHDLGVVGEALGITEDGRVIGNSYTAAGESRVYLWNNGVLNDLGTLGGDASIANHVSNGAGAVVGQSKTATGEWKRFLWDGQMHEVDWGGYEGQWDDVNNAGQGVGTLINVPPWGEQHWFLWDGEMNDLGLDGQALGINDLGQVVGVSTAASGEWHVFLWEDGTSYDLGTPGGNFGYAEDINNVGQLVVMGYNASGDFRPFLWDDGMMYELSHPLGYSPCNARTLNDAGQVVGWCGFYSAVLWRRLTPVEHLETCAALVADLEAQDVLNKGQAQSFVNKINVATAMLNDGKNTPAINTLEAFQNEASGYVNGQNITPEQGEELVSCVQVVIDNAGGS